MPGQQVLAVNTLGGYSVATRLSKQMRQAVLPLCKFRQFVSVKEAWGKNKGQTVQFDRVSLISTAGGTLTETSTIPRHNIVIGTGTLTLSEWGNAIGKTLKLTALSQLDMNNPIHKALTDDEKLTLDAAVGAQFKDTMARYVAVTGSSYNLATNGTASATATCNLSKYHVENITDQLKIWNVPPFPDGKYACIASIKAMRGLKDDTATGGWVDAARYAGSKRLYSGEVGEYMQVRFMEETNVLSNTIGNASAYGEAVFFGPETVVEGIAIPEEIRVDTPKDFGRDMATAWYGILGFKIMWCSATDSESVDTTKGWVPRIVYVTSL